MCQMIRFCLFTCGNLLLPRTKLNDLKGNPSLPPPIRIIRLGIVHHQDLVLVACARYVTLSAYMQAMPQPVRPASLVVPLSIYI